MRSYRGVDTLEWLLDLDRALRRQAMRDPAVEAAMARLETGLRRNDWGQLGVARAIDRRLSTGAIVNPEFLKFAFPPRYHYDGLGAPAYFRAASSEPGAQGVETVGIVQSRQQADGRWLLNPSYDEALAFTLDELESTSHFSSSYSQIPVKPPCACPERRKGSPRRGFPSGVFLYSIRLPASSSSSGSPVDLFNWPSIRTKAA